MLLGIVGVSLEGVWLALYILVSSTYASQLSKATVVTAAGLSLTALVYYAVMRIPRKIDVVLLLVMLSLGYVGVLHLLGLLFFQGLLSGADLSIEYMLSLLSITATLLTIYLSVAFVFFLLRAFSRRSARTGLQL